MLLLWIICSIGEFIDLQEEIDDVDMEEPYCEAKYSASVSTFDHLPSIADKEKLVYSSEDVLREVSFVLTFTHCNSFQRSLCSNYESGLAGISNSQAIISSNLDFVKNALHYLLLDASAAFSFSLINSIDTHY